MASLLHPISRGLCPQSQEIWPEGLDSFGRGLYKEGVGRAPSHPNPVFTPETLTFDGQGLAFKVHSCWQPELGYSDCCTW